MRTNLPVTQKEVELRDDQMIVSTTDLKGQITYINRDFLDISGFTATELMGQPHNIVRHPDMPIEVFADLWKTLKTGRPWIGLVKNRCKNGDFYWVEAHATPLYENGQVTGYMSVRKKARRRQIEDTERAYRLFRDGKAKGMRIELGQAVKGSGLGKKFADMPIKTKLSAVMAILSVMLLIVGAVGLIGMNKSNEGLRSVYEDRTVALYQVSSINRLVLRNRLLLADATGQATPEVINGNGSQIESNIVEIGKLWDAYMTTYQTPEEKQLAESFASVRGKFVKEGILPGLALLRANKVAEARMHYQTTISALNDAVAKSVGLLNQLLMDEAKKEYDAATARFETIRNIAIALILFSLLLAVAAAMTLIRTITGPLNDAANVFMKISQGIYGNFVDTTRNDETGKFLQKLEVMQTRLGFDVAEARRISDENLRIRIALDNVSTGVMIANTDRTIIYANKSVQKILKTAESAIRQQLPNFNAEHMIGVNIDTFHKNPAHQANLLATFSSTYTANLEISGRHLRVTASPVINAHNERLGAVAEWLDRTGEVMVEKEVANIVDGAQRGDFDQRLSLEGKEGFFKQLAEGLNHLAEVTSTGLTDVARVLQAVSQGDLTQKIEDDYAGIFGQLKDDTNTTVECLRAAQTERMARDWLKAGIARFDDVMRGDPELNTLAARAISEIATYLEVEVGAVYLISDGDAPLLTLMGSYAYQQKVSLSNNFRLGEGLVGQAALDNQQILIRDVPEDYVRVSSAIGERIPRCVCVTPFSHAGRLKGVVEIGALHVLGEVHMTYLHQVMPALAVAVESAQARLQVGQSLRQAQQLTEELQVQQEELRVANEELEEQSQRLQISDSRSRTQQEELQVTNEELEEKNEILARQKREVERAKNEIAVKADELALSSKYKSEFLANMSHELRTPLNSLLLLAQSLARNREGNLSADQVESARVIYSSGSDLHHLINEILDLSKIEAGQMNLEVATLRVSDLAEGVRASFTHMAQDKGLGLDVVVSDNAPTEISSDHKRIEQILRNLVANAIKFTGAGSVTITFSRPVAATALSRSALTAGECLAIAVSDTGIGIPAAKHKLIFEAFQQADGGTARQYGGTGLGLTISRELSTLLGGEIQLLSEAGQGATFTLYLPIAAVLQPAQPPGENRIERRPASSPLTTHQAPAPNPEPACEVQPVYIPDDRDCLAESDKLILVIEDDPKFAAILVDKCHERGFKCLAAPSGEAGLELAAQYLPSAVILDLRLPGIDGLAVLSALKEDTRTRHIPVHVVSAVERSIDLLRQGAVGHAVKPLNNERLDALFRRLEQVALIQPKRLLVVEDDAQVRRETVRLIGSGDIVVDEAENGEQAMQALRRGGYDCAVVDLKLPDMDGREMLARLEHEGVTLPPIIIHTARELTAMEERGLREHAESIVIKDVRSPERLLDEVSLFLHRVVSQMPEQQQQIIRSLHDSDALLQNKKVLIVDDDMRTMFAVSRLLTERGLTPLMAENGERALQLLDEQPDVDLVLMDIMMPVMDGYETMQRIRAQVRFRKLPIITLTAKAMPEDRQKCLEAGANDYLPKPIDADRLFSLMRVWLYG